MPQKNPIVLTLTYLMAMIITAPIAKRLGLGAVLGYLVAGLILGPHCLGLIDDSQHQVFHLAEMGVIMMLFLIGLELRPRVLWKLRGQIFGLGTAQVLLTFSAVLVCFLLMGNTWQQSMTVGMILSLSSTAIVIQTLQERGLLKSTGGETAFSVLLFQDMAVIPMLAVFPLLSAENHGLTQPLGAGAGIQHGLLIISAILLMIAIGKFMVRPVFGLVMSSNLRELSSALALLVVLATTLLMERVGLSPALGAFLGGVLLAESEYRHQLEADIEPFKALLLAVFFISVGAGINYTLIAARPVLITAAVLAFVIAKWFILYLISVFARLPRPDRLLFSFSLAQGGEFAFVLLKYTRNEGILSDSISQNLTVVVALSMALAPLLIYFYSRVLEPKFANQNENRRSDAVRETSSNPVIIAGFGRFGQMAGRLLRSAGISATILDHDVEQVEVIGKFGMRAFYGDASNVDLLHAAGAAQAKVLILAIDDKEKALEIAELARAEFPNLAILARAYDRIHAYELIHRGIENVYIETAGSAVNMGIKALRILGFRGNQAVKLGQTFNKKNNKSIRALAAVYHEVDDSTFIAHAKTWITELEKTLEKDPRSVQMDMDRGWVRPPRQSV